MIKKNYNVIGVMSGTSLDGVDLAYVNFQFDSNIHYKIVCAETIAYSSSWENRLKNVLQLNEVEIEKLNVEYTGLLASIINDFIHQNNIKDIDLISSHGHTVFHKPDEGYTLQIGNLKRLADELNQTLVCDFRVQDVQLGGQGAPLVPIGDERLFSEYFYCLNLGGFSNISFVEDGKRIAYDISAVNTVLNYFVNQLNLPYDDEGKIASSGNVNKMLFDTLNELEYYSNPYPKSLGAEYVTSDLIPLLDKYGLSIPDLLCTFVEHVAYQIGKNVKKPQAKVLITGGGAYNTYLIERIKAYLNNVEVVIPNKVLIEYKEALIFALLGVLKLRNENNVLASVTGAKQNHCSGKVFLK